MADTGNGATLTLSTTGSVGAIRQMTLPSFFLENIEISYLGTTIFKSFQPSDLSDPGEITVNVLTDVTSDTPPSRGVVETGTVTWPIHTSGNTTNATLAGTGFITSVELGELINGTLQEWTITFAYDGETDPAFTGESA